MQANSQGVLFVIICCWGGGVVITNADSFQPQQTRDTSSVERFCCPVSVWPSGKGPPDVVATASRDEDRRGCCCCCCCYLNVFFMIVKIIGKLNAAVMAIGVSFPYRCKDDLERGSRALLVKCFKPWGLKNMFLKALWGLTIISAKAPLLEHDFGLQGQEGDQQRRGFWLERGPGSCYSYAVQDSTRLALTSGGMWLFKVVQVQMRLLLVCF